MYKKIINTYLQKHQFYTKSTLTNEEYANLSEEEKARCENTYYDTDSELNKWEKKDFFDFTDEQLSKIIAIKSEEKLDKIKNDVHTIKTCVIFFVVLTVISIFIAVCGSASLLSAL